MAQSNTPTLGSGSKTATAGTAVALATANRVKGVTLVAKLTNTGNVYVGGSDVASSTNGGLYPGQVLEIPGPLNLGDIYIDVDTTDEGVDFYAQLA